MPLACGSTVCYLIVEEERVDEFNPLLRLTGNHSKEKGKRMRKRIGKTVVAVTLAGSMAVTPVFAAPAKESEKQTKENSVADLQSELEQVMTKMADLETKLIAKGTEIQKASEELQQAEEKSAKQYEDMKLRIKYMYEAGDTELEKFINAESAGDALNKAEYVQAVYTYDRDKLQEYIDTKKEIETLKSTLESDKASLEKMNTELNAKKDTLTTTIQTKQAEEQQVLAAAQAVAEKRQTEGKAEKTDNTAKEETTPVQPDESVQEEVPAEPETPSEPQTPSEPETPSEPQTPSEPETPEGDQSAAQQIVSAAYSFLGIPYVWGGTTTAGFDCSGMVQAAYAAAGISIPRVSWDQGAAGIEVSASEALPGDIVYYGWHVGIYIGNGQMIHAPEEGDVVKISTVDWAAHTFVRCW